MNFESSQTLTDIVHEEATRFCSFAVNQRRRKEEHVMSDPKLRDRLESASDKVIPVIINKRTFPNYVAIDYPELHLLSENPELPIQFDHEICGAISTLQDSRCR